MKKYDTYKPSGIEWVGEVPEGWGKIHIKRTSVCKNGLFIDGDWIESKDLAGDSGTIRYLTSGNVGVIKYKEQGDSYITEEKFNELICTEVLPGDILISRLNEPIGRACIIPNLNTKIVCAVDNVIFRPDDSLYNRRYLVYQMNCRAYSDYTNCLARGTGMHRISRAMLGQISILVPTLLEQTAIADYLDAKCAKIDNVVSVQQKRIELLKELKQSIITHAVTKGLDKNAKMKDSGIEWIGKVPEKWTIKRMRFLCRMNTGDKDTINKVDDGLYPFYVRSPQIERINSYNFDGEAILMAGDGVGAGKVIHYANGKFDYHQRVYNFHNFKEIQTKLAYYYLISNFRYKIEEGGAKNTVDSVRLPWLKDFPICIPPSEEQSIILDYIEKKSTIIDRQIAKVEKQIELLNEYKQSVITECVTGKRKVC